MLCLYEKISKKPFTFMMGEVKGSKQIYLKRVSLDDIGFVKVLLLNHHLLDLSSKSIIFLVLTKYNKKEA